MSRIGGLLTKFQKKNDSTLMQLKFPDHLRRTILIK